jgi:peroxiredoxin
MQVVDLHESEEFQRLGVQLLSIAPDSVEDWKGAADDYGVPSDAVLLSDEDNRVAYRYGVMQWQAATGEPGHTFILVNEYGQIGWVRDYGAPENGGVMYVTPGDLVPLVARQLS